MSAWHVKLVSRLAGLWGPSAKILTRTHGFPVNPSASATPVTSRYLAICSRSFPPSPSLSLPVMSPSHMDGSLVASAILIPRSSSVCISRGKSRKAGRKKTQQRQRYDSDSDEDEEEMELEVGADFRDVRVRVPSLRMDALLKAGLNISRNKVEAAFYASKIRINGEKFQKKSHQCREGDEIDVIKGVSRQDPDNMYVARILVMTVADMDEDDDNVTVKLRRYPNLLIERYKDYSPPEEE